MSAPAATSHTPGRARAAWALVRESLRGEGSAWLFVFKVLLSVYLAGMIAMRLGLASPSTAMITVFVVMHRQSGMVLAKAFYRALGTIVGSIAAVTMVALFPQQPLPFLLVLSLWVGLCAGGALMFRNFRSYGFVLSGYTVAIIALPAINTPTLLFDLAVARVTEVMLGLLVSTAVFDVVFPVRLRASLRTAATALLDGFLDFVRDGTGGALPRKTMEQAHLRFVRESMALEDLRASVVFEDPEARVRSRRMRLLNQRFMASSTRFQSLHHLINRLLRERQDDAVAQALIQLYAPLGQALAQRTAGQFEGMTRHLDRALEQLPASARALRATLPSDRGEDFDSGTSLLQRFVEELRDLCHTAAAMQQPGIGGKLARADERVGFRYATDRAAVAVTVLRSFLVSLGLGLAWLQSGWVSGAGAMANVIAFTAILAAIPNPAVTAAQITKGFVLGAMQAFVCVAWVMPQLNGYLMLVAGTLPFLMVPVYLSTRPPLFGLSLGMCLGTLVPMSLGLSPSFDIASFLNNAVAFVIGAILALLAFQLIPSVIGTRWQRRRLQRELRRQVTLAAKAPLEGLAPRFESVSRDLFLQVINHTEPNSDESRLLLAWALSVHETGRTLIELRHDSVDAALPSTLEAHIEAAAAATARLYETPSPAEHARALSHLDAALALTGGDGAVPSTLRPVRQHLHLLRTALRDADSVLAMTDQDLSSLPGAPAHAAR